MRYPITITMRKERKRTRKATAADAGALEILRKWIMDNWREGFSFCLTEAKQASPSPRRG